MTTGEPTPEAPSPAEMRHLERAVELAAEALAAGDEPFGSVLVGADGTPLAEDRNRIRTLDDPTKHPEIELVRWAIVHLTPEQRAGATVFTSGEHCAMCAAAHGWAGLGRIVYAHSTAQLVAWLGELDVPASPLAPLSIQQVVPDTPVQGPVPRFTDRLRDLHRTFHTT